MCLNNHGNLLSKRREQREEITPSERRRIRLNIFLPLTISAGPRESRTDLSFTFEDPDEKRSQKTHRLRQVTKNGFEDGLHYSDLSVKEELLLVHAVRAT